MKYTEQDVLEIIKILTTKDPNLVLNEWGESKSNEPLDLNQYSYPLYVFSFPIIVNGENVADITLVQFYGTGVDNQRDSLMIKYLGFEKFLTSWFDLSHDTYCDCYLTIKKEFSLPEHTDAKGLFVFESVFYDSKKRKRKYTLSYGAILNSSDDDKFLDVENYYIYNKEYNSYRFDNGVNLQIERKPIEGFELGKQINKIIKKRKNDKR